MHQRKHLSWFYIRSMSSLVISFFLPYNLLPSFHEQPVYTPRTFVNFPELYQVGYIESVSMSPSSEQCVKLSTEESGDEPPQEKRKMDPTGLILPLIVPIHFLEDIFETYSHYMRGSSGSLLKNNLSQKMLVKICLSSPY